MKKRMRVGWAEIQSFRPQVEALEDRLMPSGYTITDLGTLPGGSDSVAYAISGSKIVG